MWWMALTPEFAQNSARRTMLAGSKRFHGSDIQRCDECANEHIAGSRLHLHHLGLLAGNCKKSIK